MDTANFGQEFTREVHAEYLKLLKQHKSKEVQDSKARDYVKAIIAAANKSIAEDLEHPDGLLNESHEIFKKIIEEFK